VNSVINLAGGGGGKEFIQKISVCDVCFIEIVVKPRMICMLNSLLK
jgi:hypothetical protein